MLVDVRGFEALPNEGDGGDLSSFGHTATMHSPRRVAVVIDAEEFERQVVAFGLEDFYQPLWENDLGDWGGPRKDARP